MSLERNQATGPLQIGGIFPHLCIGADLGPPRTECGVGALMPWAGRLWVVSYVSHKAPSGEGTGLYEITPDLQISKRPESVVGTYTNRYVHFPSNQLFIGPHVIDAKGNVRNIERLYDIRLCSTLTHLKRPNGMVYMLGMEGEFFELDVRTLEVTELFDLKKELGVLPTQNPHFKAGYSCFGRVVVVNNTYGQQEFEGTRDAGRLAEWEGGEWRILDRNPYVEVTGRGGFGGTLFATGWDRASALLKVFTQENKQWSTYRLPKGSHTYDHMWQTEWPRIRETEHERFLMDCHGLFYELSPWAYTGKAWGIRPISSHLWVLGDFCSWRGLLVLGPDNASPSSGCNHLAGEPQSGLWFGKTDDLWQFGKPQGWGGVWWEQAVEARCPSDPYLMTGFDKKVLHLSHDASETVTFTVEVDFLGTQAWKTYARIPVSAGGYAHHVFPDGFSAHWVRLTADRPFRGSGYFTYT